MAEQTLDLQLVLSGLRRRRAILLGVAVLGALLGMTSVIVWPPMYASSSLVLLPTKAANADQMAELVKTDIRIATSDSVLGPAARSLRPPVSEEDLARYVEVSAVTPLVLEIKGLAAEPQRAEKISRAVAEADVRYVTESASSVSHAQLASITAREKEMRATLKEIQEQIRVTTARQRGEDPASPQGKADATALARLTAQQGSMVLELDGLQSQADSIRPSGGASLIQGPSPAKRAGLVVRYLGATLAWMLVAVLLAAGVITFLTRRDRRLRFRDDIADAIGSPVIASVRTSVPSSVADWISLLHDYTPGAVDAWAWRQALRQLGSVDSPRAAGGNRSRGKMEHPRSITVITMSADLRGLAAGPQLAAYAASTGIRTHMVAAHRHETATALWAACASLEQGQSARPGLSVGTRLHDEQQVDLTVVLAVLDRREPKLIDVPAGSVVVLAVSAGSATAEELARLAVSVDEADGQISGILVADPDNLDRTTGRLLQHDRMQQVPLPTRLTGAPTLRPPRDGATRSEG